MKPFIPGDFAYVNRDRDHWMDADARPFIDQRVEIVRVTKSGLWLVRLPDGRERSFPKYNLDLECKCYDHCEDDDAGVKRRGGCRKRH